MKGLHQRVGVRVAFIGVYCIDVKPILYSSNRIKRGRDFAVS
jgi:hypothetical protein